MVMRNGVGGSEARASALATDALTAQLDVLDIFLPAEGWQVCRRDADDWVPVHGTGVLHNLDHDLLARILQQAEDQQGSVWHHDFHCRSLDESLRWQLLGPGRIERTQPYLVHGLLRTSDGATVGTLTGVTTQAPFVQLAQRSRDVQACLMALAMTVVLQAELDVAERRVRAMQRDAYIDPLTRVLNRAGWAYQLEQMEASIGQDHDVAIVMLDLDDLKLVNDSHGHSAGDDLLRLAAQTLASVLRSTDCVGRLGGDEFGILVPRVTPVSAGVFVERLQWALERVGVRMSIGFALRTEAGSIQEALSLADERMYERKRRKVCEPPDILPGASAGGRGPHGLMLVRRVA